MASSTAASVPNNLATAMWEKVTEPHVRVVCCDLDFVCNYLEQHGKMTVDEGDEKGRTPLMIACLLGNAKVVEYLLNLVVGVNKECTQVMNTPLHYSCKWEDSGTNPHGIPRYVVDQEATVAEKVVIVKLLLKHGAIYKANSLNLTPICYAGLHRMRKLVDLFGDLKLTAAAGENFEMEKIKGLEFMAVSHAIQCDYYRDKLLACPLFIEAKQMHHEGRSSSTPDDDMCYELQQEVFKRTECCSVEKLEAITKEEDDDAIQIEGYLVGLRIIPDELKPQYYWDALLRFAKDIGDLAWTCSITSYMLKVGKGTKTSNLDTILSTLEGAVRKSYPNLSALNDTLPLYFNALCTWPKEITGSSEEDMEEYTFNLVVEILSNAALSSHGESFDLFTTTLESVIRIVRYIQSRNPSHSTGEESGFVSPLSMIAFLPHKLAGREVHGDEIHNLKFAFCRLLELDGATRRGCRGTSLLDIAAFFLENRFGYTAEVFELILSLVKIIIRHGCTLKDGNGPDGDGYPIEESIREKNDIDPLVVRFLEVLTSEPCSVLTLEELASRVILKCRIPYRDHLPAKLQEQVAGF